MKINNLIKICALFFVGILGLSSCGEQAYDSLIPTYQGMSINRINAKNILKASNVQILDDDDDDELDDHDDDDDDDDDIEDIVDITVQTDDEVKYYVQPNEIFNIEIHLSNPGEYEIQSFTLNGKKYANYMFEKGSTLDLLLLQVQAPTEPGYIEYTLDAIKYIDGDDIEDVELEGDKTIKAGVSYSEAPTAVVTKQTIGINDAEFVLNVTDTNKLITGNLEAILTDGKTEIFRKQLVVGENTVTFNNLKMSEDYQFGITATYDMADGKDTHCEWILTNKFTTQEGFILENVKVTTDQISFDVTRKANIGIVTSVSLYDQTTNKLVERKAGTERNFSNLLSNHTYNLYADYSYKLGNTDYTGFVAFKNIKTLSKVEPKIEITGVSADKTTISYKINVEDTNGTCTLTSVQLLDGELVVKTNGTTLEGVFTDLLSNKNYIIRANYTIDYKDGTDPVNKSVELATNTLPRVAPTLNFTNISSDKTSVSYEISVEDIDSACSITKVVLVKDDKIIKENSSDLVGTFDGLDSNSNYIVRVIYTFDLNDGNGPINQVFERQITTALKIAPSIDISTILGDKTFIKYELTKNDLENICTIENVQLLKNNEVIKTNTAELVGTFDGLLSNNYYVVRVNYNYDLNDGNGLVRKFVDNEVITLAKVAPVISIVDKDVTKTEISYEISTQDLDNILTITSVDLVKNGSVITSNDGSLNGTFINLDSDTNYTIRVNYTYDLNDGNGTIFNYANLDLRTVGKLSTDIYLSNVKVTSNSAKGDISSTNKHVIVTINKVDLYKGNELVETKNTFEFVNLLSYTNYEIRINYSYDLNDGNGIINANYTYSFKTLPSLNFNTCKIINTSPVSEGEIIYMQITLDNPNKAMPSKVKVNGTYYECDSATLPNRIFVNIVNEGQFAGGDTTLKVEEIIMTLNGEQLRTQVNLNNEANVFINGYLLVKEFAVYNSKHEQVNYSLVNEDAYLGIELENKTGYNLDHVFIEYGNEDLNISFTKVNDNFYIQSTKLNLNEYEMKNMTIHSVTYSNSMVNLTKPIDLECRPYHKATTEMQNITKAEDFLNLTGDCYQLANDIDFSGLEWEGAPEYRGILLGNNHVIRNMNYVRDIKDKTLQNIGLFKEFDGVVENLSFEDSMYKIDCKTGHLFGFFAGRFSGYANNINVKESCYINLNNFDYASGVFGEVDGGYIKNCTNSSYIIANSAMVSGISAGRKEWGGYHYSYKNVFINCVNNGDLRGLYTAGILYSGEFSLIQGCVNNGNLSSTRSSAGIINNIDHGGSIIGCVNNGNSMVNNENFAGIVYEIYSNSEVILEDCVNNGEIFTDYGSPLISYIPDVCVEIKLINCVNNGKITNGTRAFLVSTSYSNVTFIGCKNTYKLPISYSSISFVKYLYNAKVTTEDCYDINVEGNL